MIKKLSLYLALITSSLFCSNLYAEQAKPADKKITTVNLKYIPGEDVLSVIKSLIDDSISITEDNNILYINGTEEKTKSILPIITQIDSKPETLNIEFIASNRKINFNPTEGTYTNINKHKTSQSMVISERQWVTLKTGLSVPIAERRRYADGTETQSYKFKKVSKSYIFRVHEFSGWSVVQVGVDSSDVSNGPVGPIEHTELNTTIIGKTGEWLEIASSNKVAPASSDKIYSSSQPGTKHIHLYVKVVKPE